VGSQYLSDPHYHKAKELIAAGEIGELLWAQVTYSRNSSDGEWNYRVEPEGTPETIDWPQWLGTAPKRPFSAERYFRWRKYWDYSGGIATDLFYHMLGPMLYAMGPQFPVRVMGSGGIFVQKDREVPDTFVTLIEYPEFIINISASMANAAANKFFPRVIYGHKGTLAFERDSVVIYPENLTRAKEQPAPKTYPIPPFSMDRAHSDDFFSCIRSRTRTVLNPELGYQIMTAIKLGVDSYRTGQVKNFDPRTRRLIGKAARRPAYEGDGINHQTT
jgi:predicted dehydrogenase